MINVITELMNWFASLFPKTQEEEYKVLPFTYIIGQKYPRCFKYCVDTHKYIVIGQVINGEIVFDTVYPLSDTHMFRAYQYAFFIDVKGTYRTFKPKNVLRQIPYHMNSGEATSYVIGFMNDKDEVFYYDQYLIQGD